MVDLRLVVFKFEWGQKAQGTQVEGHDWWNALLRWEETVMFTAAKAKTHRVRRGQPAEYLKERRCVQQSSISTETDYKVYTVGDVVEI